MTTRPLRLQEVECLFRIGPELRATMAGGSPLTAVPLGRDVRRLGVVRREETMAQDKRAPEAGTIVESSKDKPTISTDSRHVLIVAGRPPARSAWLKPLDSYDRQQRREFQVSRYG
jgi:hypothetical protein